MTEIFEKEYYIDKRDLNEKTEWLIPGFVVRNSVMMWYAPPGTGKTWLSLAVADTILGNHDVELLYMDFDNPKQSMVERNIHTLIDRHPRFRLMHRSKIREHPMEIIGKLAENAYGDKYAKSVLMMDAMKDFVPVEKDSRVQHLMAMLMKIRDAGATILVNHHTSKGGKVVDGSAKFEQSLDEMWRLRQTSRGDGMIHYEMTPHKGRFATETQAMSVHIGELKLSKTDPMVAQMTPENKELVERVKAVLAEHEGGISQTKLLENMGKAKADKPARKLLESFTGTFWSVETGARNAKIYRKIK